MKRTAVLMISAAVVCVAAVELASAEVFELANGGRIVGQLVNTDESPRTRYVIALASGARVVLDASQVKGVSRPQDAEVQYEEVRHEFPPTVEGQMALADWCRDHDLEALRRRHLERVVELDPDHRRAHLLLGHVQDKGQWMTRDELMEKRGYRRYKDRWMLPQQIELTENRRERDAAEREWFKKLQMWENWLATEKAIQAWREIEKIDDPAAVPALEARMKVSRSRRLSLLYADALSRIDTTAATQVLVDGSMADPDEEVRLACIERLKEKENPEIVAYYIGALGSKDNLEINRAAYALGQLGDPTAVAPLISVLVTTHKRMISPGSGGGMSVGFSGSGASGLSMNNRPKYVDVPVMNRAVLDALNLLTGVSFGFDQRAWRNWHIAQKRSAAPVDIRRD